MTTERVLDEFKKHDQPLSTYQVARMLGVTAPEISTRVSKLCAYGYLVQVHVSRGRRFYRPTTKGLGL